MVKLHMLVFFLIIPYTVQKRGYLEMGDISKDNIRISVVVSRQDRQYLEQIAEADRRTLSNLVSKILADYVQAHRERHRNIEEIDMPEI